MGIIMDTDTWENSIQLPRDKDRIPIRIGDAVVSPSGVVDVVRYLRFDDNGWSINDFTAAPSKFRHVDELASENAKLHDLLKAALKYLCHDCCLHSCENCTFKLEADQLGIQAGR